MERRRKFYKSQLSASAAESPAKRAVIGSMEVSVEIRTTCPRDCYDACGILVKRNGSGEVNIVGDPSHHMSRGALCGKCSIAYNGAWRDPEQRLTYPLRRVGPKGKGRFERVSWQSALADIAVRLGRIIEASGGPSILHTHYTGTCSQIAGSFPIWFFNRIGATEVDPDTVCNKAGHVALQLMYGSSTQGIDPRTSADARCIMVWGANPSATAPHADRYWLGGFKGPKIVVDPIRHATAAAADLHLQLFPGTDGALAFAMIQAIRAAGRLDRKIPRCQFHRLRSGRGTTRCLYTGVGRSNDPRAGSPDCGSRPPLCRRSIASVVGSGISAPDLWRKCNARCRDAACGNRKLRPPGRGVPLSQRIGDPGIDSATLTCPHLNSNAPISISHMDLAARLEDPSAKALLTWNNNIAASSPEQARLRKAMTRDDLLQVTIDLFQTDTADFADYVLPAAVLEFDDLVTSYFDYSISAQVKALDAPGEALPNQEIFRRLSRAMRLDDPELYETDESIIARLLQQTSAGVSFEQLSRVGTIDVPSRVAVQFEDLNFPTPSGKIRIADECLR